MIADDLDTSQIIRQKLTNLPAVKSSAANGEKIFESLLLTVTDTAFPGALIPYQTNTEPLRVIATSTPMDWRRLNPMLRAFIGPTITSFTGLPTDTPLPVELEALLRPHPHQVTTIIELPSDERGRLIAERALLRMLDTLTRAPDLTNSPPEPTSWLLARFQDHLNVKQRDAAERLLLRLKEEMRLDALNLVALRVHLLATFDDWKTITELPDFTNLIQARHSVATTALLLEALYQTRLAELFEAGDNDATVEAYRLTVHADALPLLAAPPPRRLEVGGWRLVGMEALITPARTDLKQAVMDHVPQLGWLVEYLSHVTVSTKSLETSPEHQAVTSLLRTATTESIDAMATAQAALDALSPAQRHELLQLVPYRSAYQGLAAETNAIPMPNSWIEWLKRVADPNFTNALEIARLGSEEWSITGSAADPTMVTELLNALNAAQNDQNAAARTAQALPYLVATLQRDPAFPNTALASLYANLLILLALGAFRPSVVYESSLILVDALLSVGVDTEDYREVIAAIVEIAGPGFGVDMIYWALEVVEVFMRSAAPDMAERDQLIHSFLARLTPLRVRMSHLQLEALGCLALEFGWEEAEPPHHGRTETKTLWESRLSGKRIGIYSLMENATRQAKEALQAVTDDVNVDCNADHVGTRRLQVLAESSDLVVIAWGAAKHAATEYIRERRGNLPLVYARGNGVSSLLRAVEEHFSN